MSIEQIVKINTAVLVIVLVIAVVALIYSIKTNKDIENKNKCSEQDMKDPKETKEKFSQSARAKDSMKDIRQYDKADLNLDDLRKNLGQNNDFFGQFEDSEEVPVTSGGHQDLDVYYRNTDKLGTKALTYAGDYSDEVPNNSLVIKSECEEESGNNSMMNPESLMPASWRTSSSSTCNEVDQSNEADDKDVNSQWTKYHPTRERYQRYITASGSARLGINTRSPLRKILGTQYIPRSPATDRKSVV